MISNYKLLLESDFSGGQSCVNNPNVNQRGSASIASGRQVIVPSARFNCNGRITNVRVSMQSIIFDNNFPLFQVWHPTSPNSSTYNKTGEVQLPAGEFVRVGAGRNYHSANLSLNSSNSQIEFQSGDVIGYYQPSNPRWLIWSIQTSGYTSFSNTVTSPTTSINISNVDNTDTDRQPLIELMFGKMNKLTVISIYSSLHNASSIHNDVCCYDR